MKQKLIFLGIALLLLNYHARTFPEAHEQLIRVNGADIFLKVIGNGEPIVILHGGPGLGHHYLFHPFSQLSNKYKLIFFDQRGCGRSSAFLGKESNVMDILVEDLEGLRNELKLNSMVLVGQSWGTIIAIHYYLKYPENVQKLLLLEPATASSEYTPQVGRTINGRITKEDGKIMRELRKNFDLKTDLKMFLKYRHILSKTYFFNKALTQNNPFIFFNETMLAKFNITSSVFAKYRSGYDLYDELEKIKCPTMIIHGEYDIVPTEAVKRMNKLIKHSELHIIKNCGHFVHIEKPDVYFQRIKKFLEVKK